MSLHVSTVSMSVSESMREEKNVKREFECVELGDLQQKTPCRVIHFSSGETIEEYSTEDEEERTHTQPDNNQLMSPVDTSKLTWGPYVWFQMWRAATNTVSACDYMGERMASLFGITLAKYQYAIDEYNRNNKQKENKAWDFPVSEEAESRFEGKQLEGNKTLDAKTPLEAETLDAETSPEAETLDVPVSVKSI